MRLQVVVLVQAGSSASLRGAIFKDGRFRTLHHVRPRVMVDAPGAIHDGFDAEI